MFFMESLVNPHNEFKPISGRSTHLALCHLPIVLYKEDDIYMAECPLFGVSSHGETEDEALERVKEALSMYLEDDVVQKELTPEELQFTKEEMLKKSEQIFYRYSDPDEQPPLYEYLEIDICIPFFNA